MNRGPSRAEASVRRDAPSDQDRREALRERAAAGTQAVLAGDAGALHGASIAGRCRTGRRAATTPSAADGEAAAANRGNVLARGAAAGVLAANHPTPDRQLASFTRPLPTSP